MSRIKKFVIEVLFPVFLGLLIAKMLQLFVFQTNVVQGPSMLPSFQDKDYLITEKVSYINDSPKFGDVVIIDVGDKHIIKRVIGQPGDILEFIPRKDDAESHLLINGKKIEEEYIKEEMNINKKQIIKIPSDSYYVLGDNRNNSMDSRYYGAFNQEDIISRVYLELKDDFEFH